MEGTTVEREYSVLGNLFQQIIADMKNGTPIWEDFIAKATKLHAVLKSALTAVSAYLDAFQKIADAATNARGASKEIGTALTRMCLRHKAIETKMKAFTCAIMDCLVNPLQEKLEDWKKSLVNLDKDHSREYKRARSELKKRSTDTLRLQKKARKGKCGDLQKRVETCMQDVNERRQILEDAEKKAVRAALVEERSRFCLFVALLKPVVESEVAMLAEVGHLQEGASQLIRHTNEPHSLPAASEQVISDLQAASGGSHWTPPSSPPSPRLLGLGSRKSSSLCSSISSLNSSSSGSHSGSSSVHHLLGSNGTQPANGGLQPALSHANRSVSQPPRLGSISSRDSGFTSQDTLHLSSLIEFRKKGSDNTSAASSCTTPVGNQESPTMHLLGSDMHGSNSEIHSNMLSGESRGNLHGDSSGSATWPDLKDTMQFERAASAIMSDRPHTISTAYEKGHSRPALSVHTFTAHGSSEGALSLVVNTGGSASQPVSPCCPPPSVLRGNGSINQGVIYARPPLPMRCSSLERPAVPAKCAQGGQMQIPEHKVAKPSSLPPHLTKEVPQATYVNMFELASMAASRAQGLQLANQSGEHGHAIHDKACESSTSESSLESSSGYGSQGACPIEESGQMPHSMDECRVTMVDIEVNPGFQDCCPSNRNSDGLSISLCNLEEAVRSVEEVNTTPVTFATINKTKPCVPKRRPLSMTATCPPTGLRLALAARRGSAGGGNGKPPPPVRRSSSISRPQGALSHQEYNSNQMTGSCESDDNLPPPPAFLLNPSEVHQVEVINSRCSTPVSHGKGINVAETVKALTELKHTPASPSVLRRNAALQNQQQQNVQNSNSTPTQQPVLSSFQQSKSTFTALQNSNLNPIYGPTGHKIFTYVEQNNTIYGSRNNLNSGAGIYRESMAFNNSDLCDGGQQNRSISSATYSATVSYSSSPNSSMCNSESSMLTFGQKNTASHNVSMYGQSTYNKQSPPSGNSIYMSHNVEKKNPFSSNSTGNSIYAQPSQIIAGFNNLGFGGSRNHEANMSPLSTRKVPSTRSQSADRRGSDFGTGAGLIAAISARLAPQLSPRNSRRSVSGASENEMGSGLQYGSSFRNSQDSLSNMHHSPSHKNSHQSKAVPNAMQPAFLDKLSATLRQRQASSSPNRATAVRQIINTKAQPDPRICHGSLMEQIKRGANLRRNKHCNDRSAPKIH